MKRAGVLLFYQIVGEHKLGDPRENATHQPQLQDFSVVKMLGKFAVQRRIKGARGLDKRQLISQCQHRFFCISKRAILRVIKGVNLFFSQTRRERILTIALITEAATMESGEK